MSSTALAPRRTLDLTRDPREQWNEEMMRLVASQVLKRASTMGEQVYCLAVADALGLNPFIDEIYFLPSKSKDGSGPGIKPYIGRNGLVKKAQEAGCYFESETVREHDKFRIIRKADGTRTCTHSYGHTRDRGEIVGAYAFLHDVDGSRQPAFFYAELDQYLPTYDEQWKMAASAWGNQRSAMIEKCAMIGAGRKRLQLGNVLMDGEIPRFEQQQAVGPPSAAPAAELAPAFDFAALTEDHELAERLRVAVQGAGWPDAKAEMVLAGRSDDELREVVEEIEHEAEMAASQRVAGAEGRSGGGAGDPSGGEEGAAEGVIDAQLVEDGLDVLPEEDRAAGLRIRKAGIEERMSEIDPSGEEHSALTAELDQVERELAAAENPDQNRLL